MSIQTQIPIFRAKKIDSDEYVEGQPSPSGSNHLLQVNNGVVLWREIDPSTLSIHFPNWICSSDETDEEVKVFASLQKDKRGGDEIEIRDNFQGANGTLYFNGSSLMFQNMKLDQKMLRAFQVIGIQQLNKENVTHT